MKAPIPLIFAVLSVSVVSCDRVVVDPSVADTPLPRAGDPVDGALAEQGAILFQRSCVACHKWEEDLVGPSLSGIVHRRSPEWIRGMVLAPDSMLLRDSVARSLMGTYAVPMTDLQLNEPLFRAIWEYLRQRDSTGGQ